jgi:hypothetical protein
MAVEEIGYKLTDENMRTYGGFQWELGQEVATSGKGDLCGPGWLHYYRSPLLAVLHNPMHANLATPRLFKAMVGGELKHDGWLKSGCTRMTLMEELAVPEVTPIQRVAYGILCAKALYTDSAWTAWADAWLDGTDRSSAARAAARAAAEAAARAAVVWAARAAAWAAERAAAGAAGLAAAWAADLNLADIAEQAMEISTNRTEARNVG